MKTYTIVQKPVDLSTVTTNQVKQLVTVLQEHENTTHDADSMSKLLMHPEMKTRQDPYLIFKYYQRQLVDMGILVVNEVKKLVSDKHSFEAGAGI